MSRMSRNSLNGPARPPSATTGIFNRREKQGPNCLRSTTHSQECVFQVRYNPYPAQPRYTVPSPPPSPRLPTPPLLMAKERCPLGPIYRDYNESAYDRWRTQTRLQTEMLQQGDAWGRSPSPPPRSRTPEVLQGKIYDILPEIELQPQPAAPQGQKKKKSPKKKPLGKHYAILPGIRQ